jgi:glyoxylase-like metal-dependent hydrolase (beta-lactamase superfamily II)
MKEIAPELFLLRGFPPGAFNVYVVRSGERWVLVDTSTRHARRRILRQLPGRLEAIMITHAHRDHAGSMHAVAAETGAPVWGSEADADALEGSAPEPVPAKHRDHIVNRLFANWWKDSHPVSRRVRDGDHVVAGFTVIELSGHTPGHVGLWRESDRTVICADTMRSINFYTGLPQLGEMPEIFTVDVAESRRSIRKLAALEANTVCFGHGRPLTRNAADRINAFAASLPPEEPTPP